MFRQKRLRKLAAGLVVAVMMFGLPVALAATESPGFPPVSKVISLEEAVSLALANNPTGKIAVFDYEAAKGALMAARSYRWPTVSVSHRDTRIQSAPSQSNPNPTATDQYSNSAGVSWILWSGNRIESQVSQAKLGLDSSQWGIARARQQLKYDATDAYFKFMGARDAVKLSEEAVERLERYLRDVKLQFEVGVVAKVDVLRSEVELAKARQNLIETRNVYDITMANLNNIIGLPLSTELSVRGELTYERYERDLASAIDAALRQRPEISQAANAAQIGREGVTIAKAGYLPTVSATFNAGWFDDKFAGGNNYNWSAYLLTSWTVFDSGLTAGKVKQASEGYKKAQEQLKQTVDGVQLETQSIYLTMKSAEQSIQTSSAAVGLAEEDYKIKIIRYQAGVGTNLDVLDAQLALTTAKNNFLRAMYEFNNFRAKLDRAMGVPVN
jgi:outer membrane protein TolC